MKCPKCGLDEMEPRSVQDNRDGFFCVQCGRIWTFTSNGDIRTIEKTYTYEYSQAKKTLTQTDSRVPKKYTLTLEAHSTDECVLYLRLISGMIHNGESGDHPDSVSKWSFSESM